MLNLSKYFAAGLLCLGVMAGAAVLLWAEEWNAEWRIAPSFSTSKVHFTVRRTTASGNLSNSRDVPLDNFRGFSLAMLASTDPAKFEYVGDAGRLQCEGRFMMGTGSGSYTFVPDRAFAAALEQMGYDAPDDDQLFSMLALDITREFAREVHDSGLRASTRDLIRLKIHGVDGNYVRATRQAGYQSLSADDYVQLRIHGVDTDFLRDLKAAGYDLSAAEMVQLRIHGVDSSYMKGLKEAGYDHLRVEEINQLRIHGVEPEFPREAHRLGYNFTAKELAQLRTHGVDSAYLQHLQDAGMRNLTADQIAKLRIHGVN
jgi:hypothetical protein